MKNHLRKVGHIAVRHNVMGEEAVERAATAKEVQQMRALVLDAMQGGALGISTNRNERHMREDGKPQVQINELEWIKGEIWANIWHSEDPQILGKPNYIARIDPNSGKILGWIDLAGISPDDVARNSENTLNGIAYDAANDRIFVTGKNWKKLFEIKVKEKPAA